MKCVSVLIVLVFLCLSSVFTNDEFCKGKVHFTGPGFTCCNEASYTSPVSFLFHNQTQTVRECASQISEEKLVKRTWLLYKCLVEKGVNGALTIDSFTQHMMQNFPNDVKATIKGSVEAIKPLLPKPERKRRRRRNARHKREGEESYNDTGGDGGNSEPQPDNGGDGGNSEPQPDNGGDGGTGSGDGSGPEEGAPSEPGNENNDTGGDDPGNSEHDPDNGGNGSNPVPSEPDNGGDGGTENGDESKPPEPGSKDDESNPPPPPGEPEEPKSQTNPTFTPMNIPVYRYLSVFEYISKFEAYIPDKELLRWWDVYYVAEFEACNKISGKSEELIKSFGSDRCLSWIQRTARDGECCNFVPIPVPLSSYPYYDREMVQNYTADQILSIAGKYIATNLTYSSNVYRCNRLAMATLQGQIALDTLRSDVESFKKPNYKDIAKRLIPQFYSSNTITAIIQKILPYQEEEKAFYKKLDLDGDIQQISSFKTSIYEWASAAEWDNPHENKTRYLMWTCDAYRMISERIRYYDMSELCY